VAVVFGGTGEAYERSCAAAVDVIGALDRRRYAVRAIRVSPHGEWAAATGDLPHTGVDAADLARLTPTGGLDPADSLRAVLPLLRGADVVYPLLEGPRTEIAVVARELRGTGAAA